MSGAEWSDIADIAGRGSSARWTTCPVAGIASIGSRRRHRLRVLRRPPARRYINANVATEQVGRGRAGPLDRKDVPRERKSTASSSGNCQVSRRRRSAANCQRNLHREQLSLVAHPAVRRVRPYTSVSPDYKRPYTAPHFLSLVQLLRCSVFYVTARNKHELQERVINTKLGG